MTADLTPERAADELAAVSQESGRGDEPAREIPADELAEARRIVCAAVATDKTTSTRPEKALDLLLAEYDERGRERDAARAEVERLHDERAELLHSLRESHEEQERMAKSLRYLRAEVERLHTWAGLMSLLDEHYPADVMTGESGDPGPRIVALTREVERLRDLRRQLWQTFGRPDGAGMDVELVEAAHDWRRSSLDRGTELERLRAEVQRQRAELVKLDGVAGELNAATDQLDELRARARRIADHDPRPEAAGAALRILGPGS